MAEDRVIY